MSAAHHIFLPFRRIGRLARRVQLATTIGIALAAYGAFKYDLGRGPSIWLFGGLLFVMLVSEGLTLLKPGLKAANGIRLDTGGLTLSQNGQTSHWRWDDISQLRLRSRLHPLGLLFGRALSFRARKVDRTTNSRTSATLPAATINLQDDFSGRLEDIRDQISAWKDDAAMAEAAAVSRPAPDPFWSFRKDRKQPKFWHVASFILGPALGVGIGTYIVHGLPAAFDLFERIGSLYPTIGGVVGSAPFFFIMLFRLESAQDNMLIASGGGLQTRHRIENRLWLWRDILDMKIVQSESRGSDGAAASVVAFRATHDGSQPGKQSTDGKPLAPVSCSIEDVYEIPVADIARHVRGWWEWSGAAQRSAVIAERTAGPTGEAATGADMTSFRRHTATLHGRSSPLDQLMPFLLTLPLLAYVASRIWMLKTGIDFGIPWWISLSVIAVIALGGPIAILVLLAPALNRLDLDRAGLLRVRYGLKRRWAWHELGSAELRRVRSKWSAKRRPVLTLAAPRPGFGSALLRWAFNIDNPRLTVIEDLYDTPLDEIRDRLEQYRRRSGAAARREAG